MSSSIYSTSRTVYHENAVFQSEDVVKYGETYTRNFLLTLYPILGELLVDSDHVQYSTEQDTPMWSITTGLGTVTKTPTQVNITYPGFPTVLRGVSERNAPLFATVQAMEYTRLTAISQAIQ